MSAWWWHIVLCCQSVDSRTLQKSSLGSQLYESLADALWITTVRFFVRMGLECAWRCFETSSNAIGAWGFQEKWGSGIRKTCPHRCDQSEVLLGWLVICSLVSCTAPAQSWGSSKNHECHGSWIEKKQKPSECSISMANLRAAALQRSGQGKGFRGLGYGLVLPGAALAWGFLLGMNDCCFFKEQAAKGTQ